MIKRARGFYSAFDRKDGGKSTHFCAGCGHGIIHKLIAEAMADLDMQDESVFVSPVGCGAFCYYYFDTCNVAAPHGRAAAVATGLSRSLPGKSIIVYQGDGDLGAIGFNNAFQAANRGDKFALFFVNNSIFAMTGGQMAPTTLAGQKTITSPFGRDVTKSGYPLRVCEIFAQLEAPAYIERVSVADTKRILQARRAVRKALQYQKEGKGFAFVELLSPCPTNWKMDPLKAADFVTKEMEKTFPLGRFRDRENQSTPQSIEIERTTLTDLMKEGEDDTIEASNGFAEKKLKFSGFGGQGILSLGLVLAQAAGKAGLNVSWFPSYGPEQRGGSASCSVVMGSKEIGSPVVDHPDILVAMNQPALEKFLGSVSKGGLALYDSSIPLEIPVPNSIQLHVFPAMKLAAENGVPKAANTALLGALNGIGCLGLSEVSLIKSLEESFAEKPQLVEKNLRIFKVATQWVKDNPHCANQKGYYR